MRVLLVSAHNQTPQGNRQFEKFWNAIKRAFKELANPPADLRFKKVDINNIDQYLYIINTPYNNPASERAFNLIDFVFIDGEVNNMPWIYKYKKLVMFIKMCQLTKKVMLATTFATQALFYLSSCTFSLTKIINGRGLGGSLEDMKKYTREKLQKTYQREAFLDNATGDLYVYNQAAMELWPVSNTGLHHRQAAQTHGKMMINHNQYIPQVFDEIEPVYQQRQDEVKCRVVRNHISHWATKDIGHEQFLVPLYNKWDMHPVNFINENLKPIVLAESPFGPSILQQNNSIMTHFSVNTKYPKTYTVIKNFVEHFSQILFIRAQKIDLNLSQVGAEITADFPPILQEPSSQTGNKNDPRSYTHSGFTFSKRSSKEKPKMLANATTENRITFQSPDGATESQIMKNKGSELSFISKSPSILDYDIKVTAFNKTDNVMALRKAMGMTGRVFSSPSEKSVVYTKPSADAGIINFSMAKIPMGSDAPSTVERLSSPRLIDITPRKEPTADEEEKELLLTRRQKAMAQLHPTPARPKSASIKVFCSPRPYSAYKSSARSTASIASSRKRQTVKIGQPFVSIMADSTPYKDRQRKDFESRLENKNKWVGSRDFQTIVKSPGKNEGKLWDTVPLSHSLKWRKSNKAKWLDGQFYNC